MSFRFDTLEQIAAAGYVIDEFARWQQGECGTYAVALLRAHPEFRFAVNGETELGDGDPSDGWSERHFFAYDPTTGIAYDSLGAHSMPYMGIEDGENDYIETEADPEDFGLDESYGEFQAEDLAAALDHATRHGILSRVALSA